jgi:hypothetical protein
VVGLKRTLAALALACAAWLTHPAWADAPPAVPAMLQAEVYAANIDVTQYWVSEKFDGVRAQRDGHTLHFRGCGLVPAPAWFTANFPVVPLDGKLWIDRNKFDALSGTVRKIEPVDAEWRQMATRWRGLEGGLARLYKDMVAKAAWLATKRNATPRVLQALAGYATAIRKIGQGTPLTPLDAIKRAPAANSKTGTTGIPNWICA